MKFLQVVSSGTGFRLEKTVFLRQEMQIKKIVFNFDVITISRPPYDTHPGMVINRAKFVVCRPSSSGRVKTRTYVRTYR